MKVLIATDFRIVQCDSRFYFPSQFSTIFKRYFDVFGKLSICARVIDANEVGATYEDVTHMILDVINMPSLLKTLIGGYKNDITNAVKCCDLVIARCPGMISFCAAEEAKRQGKLYFAESMGCAWDAYWNHGILGKILAPYMFFKMKSVVKHADYALYVTSEFLQKRYPCDNPSIAASNVLLDELQEEVLQKRLEHISNIDKTDLVIMTTAAVDVQYKGQEYVIKAIPRLNKRGIRVKYLLVGGGSQEYLRKIAEKHGVISQVQFLGRCSLSEVFELVDKADIYVQPSLQEGLPRSVIEAMSRGCLVLGADTAGIPELIPDKCVFKRKSEKAVERAVITLLEQDLGAYATRNFHEAKKYTKSKLDTKRNDYFQSVKRRIEGEKY